MSVLNLYSLNTRGLRQTKKRVAIFKFLKKKQNSITLLQETHSVPTDVETWKKEWGGHLGLWGNDSSKSPGELEKSIVPKFNRAVIFDTTCNSWHGLPQPITCPLNESRKSIAVYYLCEPPKNAEQRGKALFAPTKDQENNKEVLELIKKKSSTKTAFQTYRKA